MKVVVDFDICASTGACTQVAPDVFEIRQDGYLYILVENPEGDVLVRAQEAVELCPTAAITIEE